VSGVAKTVDPELARRVKSAAEAREGSAQDIADALGIDRSNVSRMLNGQRAIGASELVTISDIVQVPLLELLGQTQPRLMKMAARLAVDPQEQLAPAQRRAARLLELRDVLSRFMHARTRERLALPVPGGTYEIGRGRTMAETARRALGLGDEPVGDIAALIQDHFAIDVALQPLGGGLAGLLIREGSDADSAVMILVNSSEFYGRQRLTCAHELGHHLFGDGSDQLVYADYLAPASGLAETRANVFALHFLLPASAARSSADALDPTIERNAWCQQLVGTLAGRYELSIEATANHLNNLGIITADEARMLREATSKRALYEAAGYGEWFDAATEAKGITLPPSLTTELALTAYQNGLVGIGTLAELYETDETERLAEELAASGWAPQFT